jgi:HlyD family secretion protein
MPIGKAVPGKPVSLRVRPVRSVDLCYPVDGLISHQPDMLLGSSVHGLDIESLYQVLLDTVPGDPSRLEWTSDKIYNFMLKGAPSVGGHLSYLRNRPAAAELDSAVMMRQNAYLTTYAPPILDMARRVYYANPGEPLAVRKNLMQDLEQSLTFLFNRLDTVYADPTGGYDDVVMSSGSFYNNDGTQYVPGTKTTFYGNGGTKSWGYEFRHPSMENRVRWLQARAAVRQELLNAERMSEMCRHPETFLNELRAIDQRIFALQAAYADTFLISPFNGIVTGVFKAQGDCVQAGEPVLRVENDAMVYLVGTVKYRGMIRVGSQVTVTTTLFDTAGAPTPISGSVSAVRGHNSVAEQWDILITCANRTAAGDPILPVNYNFDFESTTVEVTAF